MIANDFVNNKLLICRKTILTSYYIYIYTYDILLLLLSKNKKQDFTIFYGFINHCQYADQIHQNGKKKIHQI